jgi:hypothetical protein
MNAFEKLMNIAMEEKKGLRTTELEAACHARQNILHCEC